MLVKLATGVNFNHVPQAALKYKYYKSAKQTVNLSVFFALSGFSCAKAARKMLLKLITDRDENVKVFYENIMETQKSNFNKEDPSKITTSGTPYDPQSIMHYGSSAFSKNGRETIVAIKGERLARGTRCQWLSYVKFACLMLMNMITGFIFTNI